MNKSNTHPNKPPLFPITPEPDAMPFLTVSMDWITKLPPLGGFDSILTITDHDCSKAVILLPCRETMTTLELAQLYGEHVFPHYGLSDKIISDQDPRLTSELARDICNTLNIQQNISTAYHLQTDGQLERTNQTAEVALRILCGANDQDWSKWLLVVQYVLNSQASYMTKQVPYEVLMGYLPKAHQILHQACFQTTCDQLQAVLTIYQQVLENIEWAQKQLIRQRHFKPSILVWRSSMVRCHKPPYHVSIKEIKPKMIQTLHCHTDHFPSHL